MNWLNLALKGAQQAPALLDLSSRVKDTVIQELKAGALCLFILGFSCATALAAIACWLILPQSPGYGLAVAAFSLLMAVPSILRLKIARSRIAQFQPLIDSAQQITELSNQLIQKADVAASKVRQWLRRSKENRSSK